MVIKPKELKLILVLCIIRVHLLEVLREEDHNKNVAQVGGDAHRPLLAKVSSILDIGVRVLLEELIAILVKSLPIDADKEEELLVELL